MKGRIPDKLKKDIEGIIRGWELDTDEWREMLEKEGVSEEEWSFQKWYKGREDVDWDANWNVQTDLWKAADSFLEQITPESPPWPSVTAEDFVEACRQLVSNEPMMTRPTCREFLNQIEDRLWKPVRLTLTGQMQAPYKEEHYAFEPKLDIHDKTAIQRIELTNDTDSSYGFKLLVEGHVAEHAKSAYAMSIVNTVYHCAILSCTQECAVTNTNLNSSFNSSLAHSVPRVPGLTWESVALSDGVFPVVRRDIYDMSALDYAFDIPNYAFSIRTKLAEASMERFSWLCKSVVFVQPKPLSVEDKRINIIRHSIWRMSECAYMGRSPLVIIGYMSIFEKLISAIKLECRPIDSSGGIANEIARLLGLNGYARKELGYLFTIRNKVTHELDYQVRPFYIWKAWLLVKTSLHYLIVALSHTDFWSIRIRNPGSKYDETDRCEMPEIHPEVDPTRRKRFRKKISTENEVPFGYHLDGKTEIPPFGYDLSKQLDKILVMKEPVRYQF